MDQESVTTKSIKKGLVSSNPIVLEITPDTLVRFEPLLHEGGVRGAIVKYKKDKKRKWREVKKEEFGNHPLSAMQKISVPLTTEAVEKLFREIENRKKIIEGGLKGGEKEYVVADKDSVLIVDDENKRQILEQLIKKGYSDEYWELIASAEPELANKLSAGRIQMLRKDTVVELKTRLKSKFSETSGTDSWQSWILRNHWLFGSNYQEPIEKQKINITGVMPDYLFPTIDGFVDLLEIKLPEDAVIVPDSSHPGSWKWTAETNAAIGQVVFYLSEIDRLKLEIEREIRKKYGRDVSMLKPRAYILIGDSETWTQDKKEGLRKLNGSLHAIEVITYRELVRRGEAFLASPVAGVSDEAVDEVVPF